MKRLLLYLDVLTGRLGAPSFGRVVLICCALILPVWFFVVAIQFGKPGGILFYGGVLVALIVGVWKIPRHIQTYVLIAGALIIPVWIVIATYQAGGFWPITSSLITWLMLFLAIKRSIEIRVIGRKVFSVADLMKLFKMKGWEMVEVTEVSPINPYWILFVIMFIVSLIVWA